MAELLDTIINGDLEVTRSVSSLRMQNRVELTGTDIDFKKASIYYKTISSNLTLTYSNLILNKTITLILRNISGSLTLTLPTNSTIIGGEFDGSDGVTNYIEFQCYDKLNEKVLLTISQES